MPPMPRVFVIPFDYMGSERHAVVTAFAEESNCYYVKLLDADLLSFLPQMLVFNQRLENQNTEWSHRQGVSESTRVQTVLKTLTAAIREYRVNS